MNIRYPLYEGVYRILTLDADGYPHAYIEKGEFRYEFTRASIKADGSIVADVKITKK